MQCNSWTSTSQVFNATLVISVLIFVFFTTCTNQQIAALNTTTKELTTLKLSRLKELSEKENTVNSTFQGYIKATKSQAKAPSFFTQQKGIYAKIERLYTVTILEWSADHNGYINWALHLLNKLRSQVLHSLSLQTENDTAKSFLSPSLIGLVVVFCLSIILLSIFIINKLRRKSLKDKAFLESILSNSQTIISYFKPVFNTNNDIVDFTIEFTNDSIKPVLHKTPKDLRKKLMSEALPENFSNGIFEELAVTYKDKNTRKFEKPFEFEDHSFWFATTALYLDDGILTSSIDITDERESKLKERELYDRLGRQNLQLLDNKALLTNIFRSLSHIVMHFEALRNTHSEIVDFEIVFVNDAINAITDDIPETIKGKRASEAFPEIFKTDAFAKLTKAIDKNRKVIYETQHNTGSTQKIFEATAIKLNDGVTITMRDITEEKRMAKEMYKLNVALATQNSIFKDAEAVAKIGSYIWYLDSGEAIISDNFFRILGYEPNAFTMTDEKYKTFIHPEDINLHEKMLKDTRDEGHSDIHTYRIITKDGNTKHLYLNSQLSTRQQRPVSIGVVRDISEDVIINEKLMAKNTALQRSNAELESFNRVVSHDLQEPTRKIQLFISRIEDLETDNFTDKGKLYFEKVANSARRMQTLIKYLLSYSRLNDRNAAFTEVNLNEIMNALISDALEDIDNNDTSIEVDHLPTVKAIPFQMEQLFVNLLSNSIKYRSSARTCKIHISSIQIAGESIAEPFVKKHDNYHCIKIEDNGIGFDATYKEQIFNLFERLHQREDYEGTGIGLAICKKIVENHQGQIFAASEAGQGATFTVYLPI